jgi:glycolate oxidase iron-sulfur subunit
VLLGDELDSPRGRIYLIKDMLEKDRPADAETVLHVDRCLSCLSCMTTCPSGVHYMHLVDHARAHIEKTYRRPAADRLLRAVLVRVLPHPGRFRAVLVAALLGKPFAPLLARLGPHGERLAAMLRLAPSRPSPRSALKPGVKLPKPDRPRGRVALLTGCAQPVLRPEINEATVRLLDRLGIAVVLPKGEGCCGALAHHLGEDRESLDAARRNVDAWTAEIEGDGLDAVLITASGCGTTIKDYGHMLRNDPAYAAKAARVSALAKDVTEYLSGLALPAPTGDAPAVTVAYHSACSMQHGQKIRTEPKALLAAAGFTVRDVPEGHLCCGSAGTYNMLQPEISQRLKTRKLANIAKVAPDVIATGNIGCITQLAGGAGVPVLHTVELLDWATGGPMPSELRPFRDVAKG